MLKYLVDIADIGDIVDIVDVVDIVDIGDSGDLVDIGDVSNILFRLTATAHLVQQVVVTRQAFLDTDINQSIGIQSTDGLVLTETDQQKQN